MVVPGSGVIVNMGVCTMTGAPTRGHQSPDPGYQINAPRGMCTINPEMEVKKREIRSIGFRRALSALCPRGCGWGS
jgi:hypothetical protein